jgi:hypothetical protein
MCDISLLERFAPAQGEEPMQTIINLLNCAKAVGRAVNGASLSNEQHNEQTYPPM